MSNASIHERGDGFPDVGAYVPGDDGSLYLIVSLDGPIHTGPSGSGASNYVYATVEPADWDDCDEGDEFDALAVIDDVEARS